MKRLFLIIIFLGLIGCDMMDDEFIDNTENNSLTIIGEWECSYKKTYPSGTPSEIGHLIFTFTAGQSGHRYSEIKTYSSNGTESKNLKDYDFTYRWIDESIFYTPKSEASSILFGKPVIQKEGKTIYLNVYGQDGVTLTAIYIKI